jgi:deoxyribodipyrimidine photo-lyase
VDFKSPGGRKQDWAHLRVCWRLEVYQPTFLRHFKAHRIKCVVHRMNEHRAICWLRRDLRLSDSAPLAEATQSGFKTAVVFIWDEDILKRIQDPDNRRVTFIFKSLQEIDEKLKSHGSRLLVRRGKPYEEIPKLAKLMGASLVVWGEDYDPAAIQRDLTTTAALQAARVESRSVKDIVVFHKDEIQNESGRPFKVYSPYARRWKSMFLAERDAADHTVTPHSFIREKDLPSDTERPSLHSLGFNEAKLWLEPGENAANRRLAEFDRQIEDYERARDFPAAHKTSHLSVDFRFGTLSIRAAVRTCLVRKSAGADKWLNELIWRDFYQQILQNFPYVTEKPFQTQYENVRYPGVEEHWEKWRDGLTGYPLVDAAMRCLNKTGYMHNRLRMIVAAFLTKDLLIDYRRGEAWFAKQLLDYELASNNGGWQWAASVGCDPQPYFRIFNPILQSKKFDGEGAFIKEWIPELKELPDGEIHFPAGASEMELLAAGVELGATYPKPCVDHFTQRDHAISLLKGVNL